VDILRRRIDRYDDPPSKLLAKDRATVERLQTQLAQQTTEHQKILERLQTQLARCRAEYRGIITSISLRATAPIRILLNRSPWILRQAHSLFQIITATFQLHNVFLRGRREVIADELVASPEFLARHGSSQNVDEESPPLHDYFDGGFYLCQDPGLTGMSLKPLQHYLNHGWKEKRSPHPLFDVKWYLERNLDVLTAGAEPLRHYLDYGWKEGRSPHPMFNVKWYLKGNPDVLAASAEPLKHYLQHGYKEERNPHPTFSVSRYLQENPDVKAAGIEPLTHYLLSQVNRAQSSKFELLSDTDNSAGLLCHHFPSTLPLRMFSASKQLQRVNLLTDSISHESLINGVETGILFSILLAKRWNCPFRIITRTEKPAAGNVKDVLLANNISWKNNIEFLFAHIDDDRAHVDLSREDVFVSTSWRTTLSAIQCIRSDRIVYLLQEDERMSCPERNEKQCCQETMSNPKINILVNSYLLYRHLVNDGFGSVLDQRLCFEPSDQVRRDWRASFAEAINYLSQKIDKKY
jgi:hypothetical protein